VLTPAEGEVIGVQSYYKTSRGVPTDAVLFYSPELDVTYLLGEVDPAYVPPVGLRAGAGVPIAMVGDTGHLHFGIFAGRQRVMTDAHRWYSDYTPAALLDPRAWLKAAALSYGGPVPVRPPPEDLDDGDELPEDVDDDAGDELPEDLDDDAGDELPEDDDDAGDELPEDLDDDAGDELPEDLDDDAGDELPEDLDDDAGDDELDDAGDDLVIPNGDVIDVTPEGEVIDVRPAPPPPPPPAPRRPSSGGPAAAVLLALLALAGGGDD